jgi:hypothetical protein
MLPLNTLGLAFGAAWSSGINVYATVATLGLLQHYGAAQLPGGLDVLDSWPVIGVALFMYAVEFVADKIPLVDTLWDAVHTFIRVPAGAIVAGAATADLNPTVQILALLVGGGLALSTHGTKATARAAVNTSPEPFSNWALSILEDGISIGAIVLSVLHPVVILLVILIFLLLLAWFLPKVLRRLRRMLTAVRNFLRGRPLSEISRS